MSERIHALAQRLFGKATIEECHLEEVKNLAQRFPYFAPAQFLLLEKLKQLGGEEYSEQLQKSILYYHNPLEFQYFISSDRFYTEVSFDTEEQPYTEEQTGTGAAEEAVNEETPIAAVDKEAVEGEPAIVEVQTSEEPFREASNEHSLSYTAQTEAIAEEKSTQVPGLEPVAGEPTLPSTPKLQTPGPQPEAAFTFEPYHTVDYFASQGIKLSQEEAPKDKFGKQLKSFTEWLKTMKRLPATQMESTVDAGSESKVQHLADDSIHESDVWTEAMAEVWTKQGNTQKAIDTYNKLSLLNPSKKAYFATKIENLKRS